MASDDVNDNQSIRHFYVAGFGHDDADISREVETLVLFIDPSSLCGTTSYESSRIGYTSCIFREREFVWFIKLLCSWPTSSNSLALVVRMFLNQMLPVNFCTRVTKRHFLRILVFQ